MPFGKRKQAKEPLIDPKDIHRLSSRGFMRNDGYVAHEPVTLASPRGDRLSPAIDMLEAAVSVLQEGLNEQEVASGWSPERWTGMAEIIMEQWTAIQQPEYVPDPDPILRALLTFGISSGPFWLVLSAASGAIAAARVE